MSVDDQINLNEDHSIMPIVSMMNPYRFDQEEVEVKLDTVQNGIKNDREQKIGEKVF